MELRVYQTWKGSNKFLLGGRLVFGPDIKSLFVTLFLLICPSCVFCVFVAKDFLHRFHNSSRTAIMVVMVVFTTYILILLLMTSARDPGIIPRNTHPPEPEEEPDADWSGGQTPRLRFPRTKDMVVNGVTVKVKYCDTCMLYRPPRCSHCSICNNCVERFDHHCPWVGQCIGQRNYRFFFMFVSSATLLCIFVFAVCALKVKFEMQDRRCSVWTALRKTPAAVALMAYTFIAVWFVGGLTLFHLYLISTNQTTYENFRYRYDNKMNPYNLGIIANFSQIFCSSIPPSKAKFRAKVQPRDMSSVQNPSSRQMTTPGNAKPDMELGIKPAWSDQTAPSSNANAGAVVTGTGVDNSNGGAENTGPATAEAAPHPRRSSWGRKSGSWEITPDIMAMAAAEGGSQRVNGVNSASTPPANR